MTDIYNKDIKVLIVDDSPEDIKILANSLPDYIKKQVALDGNRAINILNNSTNLPDLIFLDVMMPKMNGYEVCEIIKSNDKLKDIPIIFLSADSKSESKVDAFSKGGIDYITKPYEKEEVLYRLKVHLKESQIKKELEESNRHLVTIVNEKIQEIAKMQIGTTKALIKLLDIRDGDTGLHVIQSQLLCKMIAEKLKENGHYTDIITMEYIDNIFLASPLHDIGKVAIPDYILLKPGKLTEEEFEIMKKHTTMGADYLLSLLDIYPDNKTLEMGEKIARYHHERWDGKGYPEGLRGNDIPVCARIMAIADVYNALISKRVYKDKLSHQESIKIISNGRGTYFDPTILDAFLNIEHDIGTLLDDGSKIMI